MEPNPAVFTNRFGVPRFVWFSALKNSPRVSSRRRSPSAKPRNTLTSSVSIPGPTTEFLPTFPNEYAGGAANAAGLNHVVALRVPAPNTGLPVAFARTGFSPSAVPAFAVSPNSEMVSGNPLCTWKIPDVCQFLVTARVTELRPHIGTSYTALTATRFRTSHAGPFSALRSLLFCGIEDSNIGDRKSGAFDRFFDHV